MLPATWWVVPTYSRKDAGVEIVTFDLGVGIPVTYFLNASGLYRCGGTFLFERLDLRSEISVGGRGSAGGCNGDLCGLPAGSGSASKSGLGLTCVAGALVVASAAVSSSMEPPDIDRKSGSGVCVICGAGVVTAGVGTAAVGAGSVGGCGAGGDDSNVTPLSSKGVKSARELQAGSADSSNI